MTPDVNVLVAAFCTDHSHHAAARAWLAQARHACAQGSESLTLLPMAVGSFRRLVTNRRLFVEPDSLEDAIAFIDAVLESPGVRLANCGDAWPLLRNKLLTLTLHEDLVTNTWITSAVEGLAEHLVTFDRDFKKMLPARDLTLLGRR